MAHLIRWFTYFSIEHGHVQWLHKWPKSKGKSTGIDHVSSTTWFVWRFALHFWDTFSLNGASTILNYDVSMSILIRGKWQEHFTYHLWCTCKASCREYPHKIWSWMPHSLPQFRHLNRPLNKLLCFEWSPPWHFKTACWHHFCLKLLSRDFCPTNYPNHLFHLAGHCACQSVKQDINMSVGHVK